MIAGAAALWRRLPALLWPARCLPCGEDGDGDRDLCAACSAALPRLGPACAVCALPIGAAYADIALPVAAACADGPQPVGGAPRCGRCARSPPPYASTCAAFAYRPPVDRLLVRFKFHGDLAAGRLLATLLADAAATAPRPDALLPVPLHRGRLRERGYDQALELARPLARAFDLPLLAHGLVRMRPTQAQTELDAGARRRNLRGAFAPGRDALPAHVALVDDVMTTGATLAEAARVLRRAGVARVDVWVVARA